MQIIKLYILILLATLVGCSTPSKENSTIPNSSKDNIEGMTDIYPDCFSDIDTANVEQGLGCGSIFLYKKTNKGIITVSIDPKKINLSTQCTEYSLVDGIDINLEVYPTETTPKDSIRTTDLCGCVKYSNEQKRIAINAKSGKLTAVISPSKNGVLSAERITVRLNDLKFDSPITGDTINFDNVLIWNAYVAWFAG